VREVFLRSFRAVETLVPPYRLLVLGGSGGARAINEAMLEIAPALLEYLPDWEILHQAGPLELERLGGRPRHPRHALVPFLTRMDEAMEAASLVVSRAGASTCAELKAAGWGALLVPLPISANGHQHMNALAMAGEGRALVLGQAADLAPRLQETILSLAGDPRARQSLCKAPELNRAVELCLDDLSGYLGSRGSANQATATEMK
jgi:UDP-N-acetylglucosamine--N-acetylmuramyl-(pentapeptide) pyrophosphoryl-undecaprenol N-acetylglucosamine transferase